MSLPLDDSGTERPTRFGQIHPPDHDWLVRQAREEVLLPALPIIDPHHHVWDVPGFRYALDDYVADAGSGHNVVATVYADCGASYRADGPVAMRPVGETEHVVGIRAESRSGRHGSIRVAEGMFGYADLTLGAEVEDVLRAHRTAGGGCFKGIRFATNWDPSDDISNYKPIGRAHVLSEPAVREGLSVLARLDLVLDSLTWFTQAADVVAAADAVPGLTIVVEHCGGPLGYGPYAGAKDENFSRWKTGIVEMARRPGMRCKLGGLMIRAAAYDYLTAAAPPSSSVLAKAWQPWIETCIELFGPDRCMFESNFPLDKIGTGWLTLWNAYKQIAVGASEDELRALFSGTAARTYHIEDEPRAARAAEGEGETV